MACSIYSGVKLSNDQIRQLARQAGWPEILVPIVAAVSLAESGGDPGAMNICGEHSVGLLQVNQRSHNVPTSVLTNPLNNLKVAYDIYKVEGPDAWKNSWSRGGWKKYAVGDEKPGVPPGTVGQAQTVGATSSGSSFWNPFSWLFDGVSDGPTLYKASTAGGYQISGSQRYALALAIVVLVVAFAWSKT